ncbi:type IX secretion system membrane protein, PorP/SprF family [Chitinophaga eiseniae]|uniref:Type IX secretion system membrane protein, PorP/SprF family n=1 Tax=Chitinophaga eiseniae TaxID=634771 RepID=A0A1T4T9S7_9BACT|nr:type IX secretion system membrane protein PorP/SprF [Chitinophaga eiseniae]SKA37234.1 type IX secretion system membrane protein, PorP/SprF family [Chitinophaga eiseniae]
MQTVLRAGIMVLLLAISMHGVAQQNIQFSQYIFNGLSVNPAYAGYKEDLYVNAIYRHQWAGFPGAPRTGGISLDGVTPASDNKVGLGVQMLFDKSGPQDALSLYGSYSYRIPLDDEDTRRLCLGIGGGVTQYSIDGTALQYIDNEDAAIPLGKKSVWVPDARFGIYYYTPRFYAGASVMDLFSLYTDATRYNWKGNNYSTIRKTQHLYITTGAMFQLSENLALKPSILIKEDFKGPTNVDINAFLLIGEKLWVGASYRTGVGLWRKTNLQKDLSELDAASVMVEFYATEKLRIGYAYDLTINKMAGYQGGSHEISLGFLIPSKNYTVKNPRYF